MSIKKNFFAPLASGLGATRRAAALLLVMMLTATMAQTTGAQETSTITVGGTDYTLFTGFTATDGNGNNWANLVDGNTSTDWMAQKTMPGEPDPDPDAPPAPTGDFAGGTEDPAFVEFHADEPFIPKGYVLTCVHENEGFWKPVEWALKAKLNESDGWTTIHSSTTTLGQGKTFEIACDNDGDNEYQYFRLEVYEVGTTMTLRLDELQFYGLLPTYTHLTVKAATCMATGIKVDCYRRNSDGKYFTDNTGTTELAESDVIAPIIPHTGEHHEATDVNIEYWQCSMCGKYFSDEGCTTEITKEQTKIYRTITIDSSISGLVTLAFSETQALAGTTMYLYVSDLIDASTLKVNNGAVELTAVTDIQYTFTMPAADVTVTADVAQSNADGDNLTGSIRHTVTIPHGASITLNNATITGSIVCEGSATITLVGTNSVSGAMYKAGIQIGGSGTTLTIKGDGSLTANGGSQSAGIGLSRIWNYDSNVTSGDIVIEGGTITATGGKWGAGIGTGVIKNTNNDNSTSVQFGNVTIKGGTVTATGGDSGDGIGKGDSYPGPAITFGTVTIYDAIDKVDASSIKDFGSVVYMHGENNVTASKTDYFAIGEDGNRRLIVQKPVIADIPDQTYTGSAITPEPLVMAGSLNLTKGTDYVYSYTSNTDVGTATVRATFQGDYESLGYVEKEFNIVAVEYTITDATDTDAQGTLGFYSDENCSTAISAAEEGATVYIKSTPNTGYELNSITTQKTVPSDVAESRRNTPATVEIALGGEVAVTAVDAANGIYKLTMPSSNVTVEATFTPITYNIEYELVGGTVATANPTEYTVESTPITLVNPTLEGYTFGGWTGSNGDTPQTEVIIATGQTGDRSYKAVWYTEATVQVAWDDMDNHDGIRPASVTATLSDGTEVTLNNGNSWTATVEDLPAFDAENKVIAYTWTTSTVDGYELEIELGDAVTTLTYSHTPTHDFTFATGQTWMTWCGSEEYALPSGLEAYTVSGLSEDGTKVVLAQQESILADTPLLLKGTAGTTYSATYSSTGSATGLASTPIENVLTFYGNPTDGVITTGYNYEFGKTYVLYKGAFVLVDSDQGLPAHKCLLTLSSAVTARLGISIEGTTGLTPIPIPTGEGSWYDLQGRKLSGEPTKHGIYIFKGKKVKR